MKVIPELRLAFSYFTPREIDEIGGNIAEAYGMTKKHFKELKSVNQDTLQAGLDLNKYALEVMKEEEFI